MPDLNVKAVFTAETGGLKKGVKASAKDLKALAKSGTDTAKKLGAIDKSSIKSTKSIKKLGAGSKKLGRELKKTSRSAKDTARAFGDASRTTGNFANKENALGRAISNTTRKIKNQITQTRALGRAQKNASKKRIAAGVSGVANAKTIGAGGAVASASKKLRGGVIGGVSKKLMAGVAAFGAVNFVNQVYDNIVGSLRQIDIGKGGLKSLEMKDLSHVVKAGREMQARLAGIWAHQFIDGAYNIRSSIPSLSDKGVADVTRPAFVTAKATKGDAVNMTSLFGTGYGMFKQNADNSELTDQEWADKFASQISAAVMENKTDGAKMQQAIQSAGDGLVQMGMPQEEIIAILGSMQQTKDAGVSGNMAKAFGANVAKAEAKFGKLKGHKVKMLDENRMLLPIVKILENIQERYGSTIDGDESLELSEVFGGIEAAGFVAANLPKIANIAKQIETYKEVGVSLDFAEKMAKATDAGSLAASNQLALQAKDLMRQQWGEVNRPSIMEKDKASQRKYLTAASSIEKEGTAFSNPETAGAIGSAIIEDQFGFLGQAFNYFGSMYSENQKQLTAEIEKSVAVEKERTKNKEVKEIAQSTRVEAFKKLFFSIPKDDEKFNFAKGKIFNDTISKDKKQIARETQFFYAADKIDENQLNTLITHMKSAIPAEKIQQILDNMLRASLVQNSQVDKEVSQTQEVDQSQDNRQDHRKYDKRTIVTNHINVKVTTNANPRGIATAIAAEQKKIKFHSPETLADGDF